MRSAEEKEKERRDIANEFNVIMKGGTNERNGGSGNGSLSLSLSGPFEVTRNEISNGGVKIGFSPRQKLSGRHW